MEKARAAFCSIDNADCFRSVRPMLFKIETLYTYGWDDANWTDELDSQTKPTRFESYQEAQAALDIFFTDVSAAVVAGNMDAEEVRDDYRIVPASDDKNNVLIDA